jgi:hypothetical protein
MAYTQKKLTDVQSAIVDSAHVKRVVRVIIEGKSICGIENANPDLWSIPLAII